jgi:hypothetical protein
MRSTSSKYRLAISMSCCATACQYRANGDWELTAGRAVRRGTIV